VGQAAEDRRAPGTVPPRTAGRLRVLGSAMTSWRTASVVLLSFSSGLPLGLVTIAIPDWMRSLHLDIRVVGLMTLAQAPWAFKVLWSPFMDRYTPPWLGRKRGWAAIAQVALFVLTLALAGVAGHPDAPWVVGSLALALAFASASQDIAIDAYAVEVLRPEEQGSAVGARIAVYRAAMFVSGGLAITLAARWSWRLVIAGLSVFYLVSLVITALAPEPERAPAPPADLRRAVWEPFLGLLARHRALEILAFVVFYKLSDQLAQALVRPFLIDMGYSAFDRGFALASVGLAATLLGTFAGGVATTVFGLGHSLWLFGVLQTFANAGYFVLARHPLDVPLMYAATGFEMLTSGMGTGAFSVLLLRMTQKRFSATQYALFSSLFGLPRLFAGPLAGVLVDAIGWPNFFLVSIACGVPGMVLLARFVPLGVREPEFTIEPPAARGRLSAAALLVRGAAGAAIAGGGAAAIAATLAALKAARVPGGAPLDVGGALVALVRPASVGDALELAGIVILALGAGLFTAAVAAARHGAARGIVDDAR
jgi:PAT family beta-lactamase induction signal transducer AmpG